MRVPTRGRRLTQRLPSPERPGNAWPTHEAGRATRVQPACVVGLLRATRWRVRSSNPVQLRLLAWLALGLLLASTSPHVHGVEPATAGHAAHHYDRDGSESESDTSISADEHHEQHTSLAPQQAHPCGLCRSTEEEPVDREAWVAMPTDGPRGAPIPDAGPDSPASLFASLHPARAPPIDASA
jgi:hypothetical protein